MRNSEVFKPQFYPVLSYGIAGICSAGFIEPMLEHRVTRSLFLGMKIPSALQDLYCGSYQLQHAGSLLIGLH
jgi:hypothetical protein